MARKDANRGQRETAAERRVKALRLKQRGMSYRDIGDQLGVSGKTAWLDVDQALDDLAAEQRIETEKLRALEDARLDMGLIALAPKLRIGDVGAVNALVRLSESRRKLWGLDAPTLTALTNPDGTPYEAQAQLIGVVLNLLAPYPDLRLALAAQLTEESEARDDVQG